MQIVQLVSEDIICVSNGRASTFSLVDEIKQGDEKDWGEDLDW